MSLLSNTHLLPSNQLESTLSISQTPSIYNKTQPSFTTHTSLVNMGGCGTCTNPQCNCSGGSCNCNKLMKGGCSTCSNPSCTCSGGSCSCCMLSRHSFCRHSADDSHSRNMYCWMVSSDTSGRRSINTSLNGKFCDRIDTLGTQ